MVKIAGVQMDVSLGRIDRNLACMSERVSEAVSQGAELVVFPECATTGYCFESLEEASEFAEPVPGPTLQAVGQICQQHQTLVVYGFLEQEGGRVFNACACVGPHGLLASYRKIHLPFLGVDRFTTPGDRQFEVQDVGPLKIGMNICYDTSFPETARVLSLAGADLIVLPTNWPPGAETTAQYVINARAVENKVYCMAVNRVGLERGFQFIGYSRICDVHGNTLTEAAHQDEAILYAEIDPAEARDKRIERVPGKHAIHRFDDRRPEMYGRLVE